ncbi:unnamed protein product [Ranitomeya imitator]|uniref:Fibrinogen alpha/beta/gamma chain coiled coil domain-containing protein n=1 Tax=Ranitomeya imitator TaxID=111125 RepID=A0ABN9MI48_9NEOB|nr:unnamed protein product [Ranitomeya imitator]
MSSLYLKLNLSKTELLVFSPSTNLPLPDIAISVCGSTITPKQHACCLGVILDSDLSFTPHIRSLARSSYLHLKNISRIRPFLTFDSAKTLTVSLIHSRLDYCNSLLIGLPLTKLSPLQSVMNAAARIIFLTNRYTDASTLCQSLHWLPIHSRIQYKTTTLIHKALHGSAPPYISSLVSVYHPTRALHSANDLRLNRGLIYSITECNIRITCFIATVKYFAQLGNELRNKLTYLKLKVNEQVTKLKHLHSEIENQLAIMKILEVDIDIKIRTCKGSCQNVQAFMTNLENYRSWKKDLDTIRNYQIDDTKTLRNIGFVNLHVQKNATCFKELWPLMEMKQLEMFESVDQYMLILEDV